MISDSYAVGRDSNSKSYIICYITYNIYFVLFLTKHIYHLKYLLFLFDKNILKSSLWLFRSIIHYYLVSPPRQEDWDVFFHTRTLEAISAASVWEEHLRGKRCHPCFQRNALIPKPSEGAIHKFTIDLTYIVFCLLSPHISRSYVFPICPKISSSFSICL